MKKATALTTLALLSALTINAQDGKSVRFGLKVAPNMGWFSSDEKTFSSDGSTVGFNFGLMGDFMIGANQNYAFSTGLMYMTKLGGKYTTTIEAANAGVTSKVVSKSTLSMQYVQIPLTMKLKTNEIGYMTYYGQIGGDLGINVGAHSDDEVSTTTNGATTTVTTSNNDVSSFTNTLRVGLIVGAGVEYNFSGNTSAMLGLTYGNGFTNAFSSKSDASAKLHYFELSLGVFF